MDHLDFIGQTLDGKYQIERELGRGGMGTVYLATHLGTERPVAVKIIAPQFMQRAEFVERFRREARAAGRLRHPNVVNVTDFGFADSSGGQVAYLVMEYLDGCTLGEILDEEKNLPVAWTLDILEQVCSAVQEAHEQGIIHRDLKPDNIWLEPNQRGGYTVKVLDFGIAKLEEHDMADGALPQEFLRSTHTLVGDAKTTIGGNISTFAAEASTIVQTADHGTMVNSGASEGNTISIAPATDEKRTAIYDDRGDDQDSVGTRLISDEVDLDTDRTENQRTTGNSLTNTPSTAGLTRVGAVLGTPLYMSPEQCRGEHLDPRSDIYSLGVIAYQMLSGATPFEGDFKDVMESHKNVEPRPLRTKKVRRKLKLAIHNSLAKDPDERPDSAEAFASVLRARSEGIFVLLQRALVIYSEHLPKFLILTAFFELPVIVLTLLQVMLSFLRVSNIVSDSVGRIATPIIVFSIPLTNAFCTTLTIGTSVWIVTQYLAVPLRPIRLKPALAETRKKWKKFAGSGVIAVFAPFISAFAGAIAGFIIFGFVALVFSPVIGIDSKTAIVAGVGAGLGAIISFFVGHVVCMLITPVVMMESTGIREAFRRSRQLTKRSFLTAAGAALIVFLIPMVLAASLSLLVNLTGKSIDPTFEKTPVVAQENVDAKTESETTDQPTDEDKTAGVNYSFGTGTSVNITDDETDMQSRVKHSILESLSQIFWLPLQILVLSFSAIIVALLYLKTRLAGGESMNDLIERFEDDDKPRKKWQERVRQRLIQSGRIPSKS